jgi:tRNA pseudouridine13 synthase
VIRGHPEDFQVEELLGYEPEGSGSHVWLFVRKRNFNTTDVARRIARLAGVKALDVGFAGLKDRRAVASQWFSVNLAGRGEPDWSKLGSDDIVVVTVTRHGRKLRRGGLRGNRFRILLRDVDGRRTELEQRLDRIATRGVPNYFGEQRFGRGAANIDRASAMLRGEGPPAGRHLRGLYLSAARALLFNRVLAHRVTRGLWNRALPGDVLMLAGSRSIFPIEEPDDVVHQRVAEQDLHPTGPLWGVGEGQVRSEARALEQASLHECELWQKGLERAGLKQERRSLRARVSELKWGYIRADELELAFILPAGAYATAVLRELVCAR